MKKNMGLWYSRPYVMVPVALWDEWDTDDEASEAPEAPDVY